MRDVSSSFVNLCHERVKNILRQIGVQLCTSHISNVVSNECCCLFYIIFLIFKVSKKKQHLLAFGYGSTTLCILCSAAITPTIVHQTSLKQILNMASKKFQQIHFLSRGTPKFNTLFKKNARCLNKYILLTYVTRIQRAWRASMSRRESWQAQDKNRTNALWRETVPSESLQEPVMTTNISQVRLRKQNQTAIWCDMRMSQVLRDVLCEWSAVICCYSREWITNGGRGCTDG